MDGSSLWIICVLFVLVALSAYFSSTETAFSSLNRVRIKNMANSNDKRIELVGRLADNYDELLSTILIGNNIVNICAASLATVLFTRLMGEGGVSVSTVVMTIIVLIFGEITPKALAKESPEKVALAVAPSISAVVRLLSPLNFLFKKWKTWISRFLGKHTESAITEEELLTIVDEAQSDGGLDASEGQLIRSAIEFNDLEVSDILTPRVDMVAVDRESSWDEVDAVFRGCSFSRLPVYEETVDHIVGIIHERDFYTTGRNTPMDQLIKPVLNVMESAKISSVLKLLQTSSNHIAIVLDEYGGTVGLVSMEDILEELVGEIWDENDQVVEEFHKLESGGYLIDCGANLEKMFRLLHIKAESDASTVSGWVIDELGRIPQEGDCFQFENLSITVTRMDARRVQQIKVEPVPAPQGLVEEQDKKISV